MYSDNKKTEKLIRKIYITSPVPKKRECLSLYDVINIHIYSNWNKILITKIKTKQKINNNLKSNIKQQTNIAVKKYNDQSHTKRDLDKQHMKEKKYHEINLVSKNRRKHNVDMESKDKVDKYGIIVETRLNKNQNTGRVES